MVRVAVDVAGALIEMDQLRNALESVEDEDAVAAAEWVRTRKFWKPAPLRFPAT